MYVHRPAAGFLSPNPRAFPSTGAPANSEGRMRVPIVDQEAGDCLADC